MGLLRNKSEIYPTGLTTGKFQAFLRPRITIVGKDKKEVDKTEIKELQKAVDEGEKEVES